MSHRPPQPPDADPQPFDRHAASLTEVCDLAICHDAPVLVGLTATQQGLRLEHGTVFDIPEELLTFEVPPRWAGVAIVADGRCRSIAHPHRPVVGRARFCFALTRDGRSSSLMITPDGSHRAPEGETPAGHAVDVCQRLLGLATSPELAPVLRLVHVEWLADLADLCGAASMDGLCEDWAVVANLHPCAHATRRTGPDALGRAAAREVQGCTWDGLHDALVAANGRLGHIPSAAVARMDGSSFARFVLGARPPLEASWAELCEAVDPRILTKVRRAMVAAGEDLGSFPLVHHRFVRER